MTKHDNSIVTKDQMADKFNSLETRNQKMD